MIGLQSSTSAQDEQAGAIFEIASYRPCYSPSPGGDLSCLGSGERNLFRVSGTKVAWRPSERARASQRRDEGELNTNIVEQAASAIFNWVTVPSLLKPNVAFSSLLKVKIKNHFLKSRSKTENVNPKIHVYRIEISTLFKLIQFYSRPPRGAGVRQANANLRKPMQTYARLCNPRGVLECNSCSLPEGCIPFRGSKSVFIRVNPWLKSEPYEKRP